jgi:hypothetical protein
MIKTNIQTNFPHHILTLSTFTDDCFVADYTEQTRALATKRGVEFFSPTSPTDIDFFSIINSPKISIDGIAFNNSSFINSSGSPKSQCESVFFPTTSNSNSWILFCELKYSNKPINNSNNLKKAIDQLYKTRYYYVQAGIILSTNCAYLIASLPMQSEPFANFSISQPLLTRLKRKRNIILRLKNKVEIIDDSTLIV